MSSQVGAWVISDLLRVAQLDTLSARNDLYLRVLYSPGCSARLGDVMKHHPASLPAATRAFLEAIDPALLALEQVARRRGLLHHILRELPSLKWLFSAEALATLAATFVESDVFWQSRGRTLGENFCLFCVEQSGCPMSLLERDLARLLGVIAGLSAAPDKPSPWSTTQGHQRVEGMLPGSVAGEMFLSDFRLVDERGAVPEPELNGPLDILFPRSPSRVVICAYPGRKLIAFTVEA